jgi:hypothetical protein
VLKLVVPETEYYDEEKEEFSTEPEVELVLEHSLVSLSKWESKYKKPFLGSSKSGEELLYYIEVMIVSPLYAPGEILHRLSEENYESINAYVDSPESATTFGEMPERKGRGETITAELIYYWMVAFNIPFECESWHLNRLFALIRICNIKNSPPKKMSKQEVSRRYADLNAQRKAQLGTRG